jgi:5-oxoprolinase (ATP-hydrolysing) subunit A
VFIDINSDLGEGFGAYRLADDAELLQVVSSTNIACGFHAGDPRTMDQTVKRAIQAGVGIGAHPGFPDRVGFGRRDMGLTPYEIKTDLLYQLGALEAFLRPYRAKLQHISPHGRLGNTSVKNPAYAEAIVEAAYTFDPTLIIMTEPGELAKAAKNRGMKAAIQLFADRAYNEDGTLVSRKEPYAVIHDEQIVIQRCIGMVKHGRVAAYTGKEIKVTGDTLCVHGDTPGALRLARKIREAFQEEGIEVLQLEKWL